MDWTSIIGGGVGAAAIASLIKGIELLVSRKGFKETHELARAKQMSEGSEAEFKRSWSEINTLWARETEREKVLASVRMELATASATAARVPELEERLAIVEKHFLDCANLLSRIRSTSSPHSSARQSVEDRHVSSELDRIEKEGRDIVARNGLGKEKDDDTSL